MKIAIQTASGTETVNCVEPRRGSPLVCVRLGHRAWSVTHRPTGLRASGRALANRETALALAREMLRAAPESGLDWARLTSDDQQGLQLGYGCLLSAWLTVFGEPYVYSTMPALLPRAKRAPRSPNAIADGRPMLAPECIWSDQIHAGDEIETVDGARGRATTGSRGVIVGVYLSEGVPVAEGGTVYVDQIATARGLRVVLTESHRRKMATVHAVGL